MAAAILRRENSSPSEYNKGLPTGTLVLVVFLVCCCTTTVLQRMVFELVRHDSVYLQNDESRGGTVATHNITGSRHPSFDHPFSNSVDAGQQQQQGPASKTTRTALAAVRNNGDLIHGVAALINEKQKRVPSLLPQEETIAWVAPGEHKYDPYQEYTPAQKCRLQMEKLVHPTIDKFLEMGKEMPPWIDWLWDMDSKFVINLKFGVLAPRIQQAFMMATWNWQDQFGNNHTTGEINHKRTKKQYHLKVVPVEIPSLQDPNRTAGERLIPQSLWATNITYPENGNNSSRAVPIRDWVYDLRPFLKCDAIEREEKLPPNTKIGMCLRYRGNHHLVAPFIAYHRLIGVQHFWLYANEPFNISDLPESKDITHIPYDFSWKEHYLSLEDTSGIPFDKANLYQIDAQQHCLFKAKRYELDWIMTQDVDEYLWLQETELQWARSPPNATSSFDSILQQFLNQYQDDPDLGGILVAGWSFGGNGTERHQLMVDYALRAPKPKGGRDKLIYRVPVAENIGVHWLFDGGRAKRIPAKTARWNHYKNPELGPYDKQGKAWNGTMVTDAWIRNKYRDLMLQWMRDHPSPLSKNTAHGAVITVS